MLLKKVQSVSKMFLLGTEILLKDGCILELSLYGVNVRIYLHLTL